MAKPEAPFAGCRTARSAGTSGLSAIGLVPTARPRWLALWQVGNPGGLCLRGPRATRQPGADASSQAAFASSDRRAYSLLLLALGAADIARVIKGPIP